MDDDIIMKLSEEIEDYKAVLKFYAKGQENFYVDYGGEITEEPNSSTDLIGAKAQEILKKWGVI